MNIEYADGPRAEFGVTIGHFRALKHQRANMAVEIEPTRALSWHAPGALDHVPDERERSAAIAKGHIAELFWQVAREAMEAQGGIGFIWGRRGFIRIGRRIWRGGRGAVS